MGSKTTLHTHTHAHTHSHTHVPTHIHTHTCSHTDTHSHADTDICSHSHEHAHTCSHKHAHTRTRAHTQQGGRLADRSRQHQPLTLDAHRWPASPDARFHSSDPHRPGASRSQTQKPTQSTQIHPHHQHQLSQIPSTHNTEHTETAGAQGPHPTFRYTASDSRTRTPTSRHIRPTHKATHPQPMNSRQRPHAPSPTSQTRGPGSAQHTAACRHRLHRSRWKVGDSWVLEGQSFLTARSPGGWPQHWGEADRARGK